MILRAPFGPKNTVCLNLTKVFSIKNMFSIKNNVQYQKHCIKFLLKFQYKKKCSVSKTPDINFFKK